MFDPLRFLKSKDGREGITPPDPAPAETAPAAAGSPPGSASMPPTLLEAMQAMREQLKKNPVHPDIEKRALRMKAEGKHSAMIFSLRDAATKRTVCLMQQEPARKSILLFSSVILAYFYVQAKKMPAEVVGCRFEELEAPALEWQRLGFDSYILDLSPKAPVCNVLPSTNGLINGEQLALTWCVMRSIRDWQAQTRLAEFYVPGHGPVNPEALQRQRAVLETLRDSGSYDVPFVHWMIALLAGMQCDEEARQASTEVLERFGPDFVGRTVRATNKEELKEWGDSLSLAVVGLLAEYGILQGLDGKPVESIIRIETTHFEGGHSPC